MPDGVTIRPPRAEDLDEADRVFRLAFGTFIGLPDEAMLGRGFRIEMIGIVMHRPDEPGYSHPGVYALDDWR